MNIHQNVKVMSEFNMTKCSLKWAEGRQERARGVAHPLYRPSWSIAMS